MDVKEYFLSRSDITESDEYRELYNRIIGVIPKTFFDLLPNVSFVMFKPNATLAGQIPEIIKRLEENNIYVFSYKLKIFTEEELDNLYMFVKMKYSESWWVMKLVYSLAPCFPAIVIGDKKEYAHLSARIRAIVGPTTPIVGDDNDLRYFFRGTHRLFNTIHATDDPASAIRESLVFFTLSEIKEALEAVSTQSYSTFDLNSSAFPNTSRELNFNGLRNKLKTSLFTSCQSILSTMTTEECSTINKLFTRLRVLLDQERQILERSYPLRIEVEKLSIVLSLQKVVLTVVTMEGRRLSIKNFRSAKVDQTEKQTLVEAIARIVDLVELILPFTDDTLLMSLPDIELFIARLMAKGVKCDLFDEAVLLGCWAGAYNEMLEIGLNWPIPIASKEAK